MSSLLLRRTVGASSRAAGCLAAASPAAAEHQHCYHYYCLSNCRRALHSTTRHPPAFIFRRRTLLVHNSKCYQHSSSSSSSKSNNNNILQEKAQRASQLHLELQKVLDQQSQRRREEQRRPFGYGLLQFVRKNKAEMINIGATFVCVLLAYQIAHARRVGRLLEEQANETREELRRTQALLRSLMEDEFLEQVALQCQEEVNNAARVEINTTKSSNGGRRSWGWKGRSSAGDQEETQHGASGLATRLRPILRQQLERRIGDTGLTEEERKERTVQELRDSLTTRNLQEMADSPEKLVQELSSDEASSVEVTEDESGEKVVKKRVFSI